MAKRLLFFFFLFSFFFLAAQNSITGEDRESLDQLIRDLINKPENAKKINDIRVWPGETSIRVAIYPSEKVKYKYNLLKGESGDRIYIDLIAVDGDDFRLPPMEFGSFLKGIRIGKRENGLRIVLDTGKVESYNVIEMEEPWRIVIDYYGEKGRGEEAQIAKKGGKEREKSSADVLKKGKGGKKSKKIVIIDPGHGGKDPGAISGNLYEKDVVFKLAKKIEKLSKRYDSIEVKLTRETDVFLPLEERAAIANNLNGDLFISLHANSFADSSVGGLELYHLDNTRDNYTDKLARVENKISKDASLINTILVDMTMSYYVDDSLEYADKIGRGLKKDLKRYGVKIRDYRKGALFYVLVGARMPSLLFEIGYLTNKKERALLQQDGYLESIAKSLIDSVLNTKLLK